MMSITTKQFNEEFGIYDKQELEEFIEIVYKHFLMSYDQLIILS